MNATQLQITTQLSISALKSAIFRLNDAIDCLATCDEKPNTQLLNASNDCYNAITYILNAKERIDRCYEQNHPRIDK